MMLKRLAYVVPLLLVLVTASVQAQAMPDQLVRSTTEKLLVQLKKNHAVYRADHNKLYAMVYEQVLPHFDFEAMSKLVLGRNWREANAQQRKDFAVEFQDLLVRTYSTALLKYTDEDVVYLPFRAEPGDNRVEVKTEVKVSSGGPNIPLNYKFYKKNAESKWKVYDVTIEGISLVTNYRSVYADKISKQGLDALIKELATSNTQQGKQAKR